MESARVEPYSVSRNPVEKFNVKRCVIFCGSTQEEINVPKKPRKEPSTAGKTHSKVTGPGSSVSETTRVKHIATASSKLPEIRDQTKPQPDEPQPEEELTDV